MPQHRVVAQDRVPRLHEVVHADGEQEDGDEGQRPPRGPADRGGEARHRADEDEDP